MGVTAENESIEDLRVVESWLNRPASEWAVQRIGVLQSKIEQFSYKIYHSTRYGKHSIAKLIPAHIFIQYANDTLGFDGWSVEVLELEATSCREIKGQNSGVDGGLDSEYEILTEARVRVVLKDGTHTESSGFGKSLAASKGDSFSKSKKQAVNDALKNCFLQFETMILQHENRVGSNYYVDGLYGSKARR